MDLGRLTQEYRNRADAENMFDELKNQWGWSGYTTQDLKRSQLMARLVGLVYNWWGIYTRMGTGGQHREAITTRPALADGVAERTEHAREVKLEMTSLRGKAKKIATFLSGISEYLHKFLVGATQLDEKERWRPAPENLVVLLPATATAGVLGQHSQPTSGRLTAEFDIRR